MNSQYWQRDGMMISSFLGLVMITQMAACTSISPLANGYRSHLRNEFESMPRCSRLMYAATRQIVPVVELDASFHQIAKKDSETLESALSRLQDDLQLNVQLRELYEDTACGKPLIQVFLEPTPACGPGWRGPYVEKPLTVKYQTFTDEDLIAFIHCAE